MPAQPSSPEALLAAIAQAGNEMTQGWMRLVGAVAPAAGAPPADWTQELGGARLPALQAAYAAKQAQQIGRGSCRGRV